MWSPQEDIIHPALTLSASFSPDMVSHCAWHQANIQQTPFIGRLHSYSLESQVAMGSFPAFNVGFGEPTRSACLHSKHSQSPDHIPHPSLLSLNTCLLLSFSRLKTQLLSLPKVIGKYYTFWFHSPWTLSSLITFTSTHLLQQAFFQLSCLLVYFMACGVQPGPPTCTWMCILDTSVLTEPKKYNVSKADLDSSIIHITSHLP